MTNRSWTGDKILQVWWTRKNTTSLTLCEIAQMLDKPESNIRTSVILLMRKGFLLCDDTNKTYRYSLAAKGLSRIISLSHNKLERQGYRHEYPLLKIKDSWCKLLIKNVCETSVTQTAQLLRYSLSTVSHVLGCRRKPSQRFIDAVYRELGE